MGLDDLPLVPAAVDSRAVGDGEAAGRAVDAGPARWRRRRRGRRRRWCPARAVTGCARDVGSGCEQPPEWHAARTPRCARRARHEGAARAGGPARRAARAGVRVARPLSGGVPGAVVLDGGLQPIGGQVGAVHLGRGSPPRASATALLVISRASSSFLPLAISVTMLEVATAAPQPRVWNLMSSRTSSLTLMVMRIMSPHWGLPTSPTPSASSMDAHVAGVAEVLHDQF